MTTTEHMPRSSSSVEKHPSTLVRVFLGMLAGAAVSGASHAAVIETQVFFLGTQLQAATLDLPSWLATFPRIYYGDIPNLLVLPLIVGGLAGILFRRPAFLRIVSVSLVLALLLLIAFSGYEEYVNHYKPRLNQLIQTVNQRGLVFGSQLEDSR